MYRIRRAVQLSLQQKILPKDQWTTREQVSLYPFFFPCTVLSVHPPRCRGFADSLGGNGGRGDV